MLNETNEIRETRSANIPEADLINRGLPRFAATMHPSEQRPIMVKRGVMGFYPVPDLLQGLTVEQINKRLNVDDAQREAMAAGSMFGFHTPGAFPEYYRK